MSFCAGAGGKHTEQLWKPGHFAEPRVPTATVVPWLCLLPFPAGEIAYGLVSILLITPLVGLLVAQLPLNPRPLAFGLGVVCTVPTALACGVAFVQVSRVTAFGWE